MMMMMIGVIRAVPVPENEYPEGVQGDRDREGEPRIGILLGGEEEELERTITSSYSHSLTHSRRCRRRRRHQHHHLRLFYFLST